MPTTSRPLGQKDAATIMPLRSSDPAYLGPYRIIGILGSGGMATVYLGRAPQGQNVAVKMIRLDLAGDQIFRKRFAREVDAAGRVDASYTATLVSADPHAPHPWMATTYIPGPSLKDVVEHDAPLDAGQVRALGLGLAQGLESIHATGLVHRDLKPGNVLLASHGPHIIDFGIARVLESTALTSASQVFGTASYMSPEQVRGKEAHAPTDVFALGCVLVYAATGNSAFGSGLAEGIAYRVVHSEPDLEHVPADVAPLLADCLAKNPADRPTPQQIVERLTEDGRGVVWEPNAALNAMIAARAKTVRRLQAHLDADPTEPLTPQHQAAGSVYRQERPASKNVRSATSVKEKLSDDDAGGHTSSRNKLGILKAAVAGLAGIGLAVTGVLAYRAMTAPPVMQDGWFTISGDRFEGTPDTDHTLEVTIETTNGERATVGYAATVMDGGPNTAGKETGDEPVGELAAQIEKDAAFVVESPWHGRIPVDETVLAFGATGRTDAVGERITCHLIVDGVTVVTETGQGEVSCVTPFTQENILDGVAGE